MNKVIFFPNSTEIIIVDLKNNKFSLSDYSLETSDGSASFFFKNELVKKIDESGTFGISTKNIPEELDKEFKFLNIFHNIYFLSLTSTLSEDFKISEVIFLNYFLLQKYVEKYNINMDSDFNKKLILNKYKMSTEFWNQILEYSKAFYILKQIKKIEIETESEFDFLISIKKVLKI